MKNVVNNHPLVKANITSVLAAIIIEALLIMILLNGSIYIIFQYPLNLALIALIIIGIAAYKFYLNALNHSRSIMKNLSPVSLILASLSIPLVYTSYEQMSPVLIVLAYVVEAIVGIYLYKELQSIHPRYAQLFILGMYSFVFSLPLLVLSQIYIIIPLIGNVLKAGGLIGLAREVGV